MQLPSLLLSPSDRPDVQHLTANRKFETNAPPGSSPDEVNRSDGSLMGISSWIGNGSHHC